MDRDEVLAACKRKVPNWHPSLFEHHPLPRIVRDVIVELWARQEPMDDDTKLIREYWLSIDKTV